MIIVPNEKLLEVLGKDMNLLSAFKHANDVLFGAVKGITDLILLDGLMNVDFADVKTVMAEMGMAMMGSSESTGENRAVSAAEGAARCPLLEDADLQGARGILVNITSGHDLTLGEFQEVGNIIREFADEDATIIVGRRPIINIIDVFSSRLIPEEYSPVELKYLEAYANTMQDLVVTKRERDLLANLANAYEISEDRLAVIEENYRESLSLGSNTTIQIDESE